MDDADQRVRDAIARGDFRGANELVARAAAPIVLARIRQLVRGTWLEKEAEDLCHAALIKAFDALRAGKFAGRSTVIGYVLGIAQHTVFHARDSWIAKLLGRAAELTALDAAPLPPPTEAIAADAIDVDALLTLLDERERVIVSLRLEDQRFEAIGRFLRIKPNTANQIYRRALLKLRAHLLSGPADPAAAASSRPRESRR